MTSTEIALLLNVDAEKIVKILGEKGINSYLPEFNWGESSDWYRKLINSEIFNKDNIYGKYFRVEEGDIVFDAGASIGPFGFSIKDKNYKHIYCIEPSLQQIEILKDNLSDMPYTVIPYAIGNKDILIESGFGDNDVDRIVGKSKPFIEIVEENNIKNIDFLKTDCEGGEYNIFSIENLFWIKENVKKISGEWHLNTPELKAQFRIFRDTYLKLFPKHEINSVCGTEITKSLWDETFIEYYNEILIYIDNR